MGAIFIPELSRVGFKLLDFGIAVSIETEERYGDHWQPPPKGQSIPGDVAAPTAFATDSLGLTGRGYGTLAFMAPEQSQSRLGKIGTHTDVFSVGATLYWCLVGSVLLGGSFDDYAKRLCDVTTEAAPARVTESAAPQAAKTLVVEMLAKAVRKVPKERFQTAEEMSIAVSAAMKANEAAPKADVTAASSATSATAVVAGGDNT